MSYYQYTHSESTVSSMSPESSTILSPRASMSSDDVLAGSSLLFIALLGLLVHAVEMVAMSRLVRTVIGFRFFMVLSIADISLLILFGIIPGLLVFFPWLLGPLTAWQLPLHTLSDTAWFSACYLNVFIALTRFVCVVFPLEFRRLRRQSTCWLICAALWAIALAQSWAMNRAPWFVTVWYAPHTYGMTCNWTEYAESGTRTLYITLNGLIIGAYLLIYASTAVIIFTKRTIRFQFFATVLGKKCSSTDTDVTNATVQAEAAGGKGMELKMKRPSMNGQNGQKKQIRTISISRTTSNEAYRLLGSTYLLEVRLVIPCCVSALIFIIAQLIIINGGIGPTGKWADLSIMLIFCLQSITPPILLFIFSTALREQVLAVLRIRRKTGAKIGVATSQRHQQRRWMMTRIRDTVMAIVRKRFASPSQ